jgi:tetratricopeptide (TPR) repeat protein
MNRKVKIALYTGLVILAVLFLARFLQQSHVLEEARKQGSETLPETHMMAWFGAFLGTVIVLGLMIAWEASHFFIHRAQELVFNDSGEGVKDPEYEEAEQLWANGQHLEAIAHLRELLKTDPRQIHAAIRIAEIYEKDLRNPLAAALEYEEILQKKLPAERWGWMAIHLVNLYNGSLDRPDDAIRLLERIAREYPRTGAARKARERLGLPEPEPEPQPEHPVAQPPQTEAEAEAEAPTPAPTPAPSAPKSNLPPGFRPK